MRFLPLLLLFTLFFVHFAESRGGRGRRKGKGKNILPFGNIKEYSLVSGKPEDPKVPLQFQAGQIIKGTHFDQQFRLGYKILLICVAGGDPPPSIQWYKNGAEMAPKPNTHVYHTLLKGNRVRTKIEIDPATMGDAGIYSCMASNSRGLMAKNFKVECDNC